MGKGKYFSLKVITGKITVVCNDGYVMAKQKLTL